MAKGILIIDDDFDFTETIKMLFESKGYKVLSASSGDSGFELAKRKKPNLILLDVMMDRIQKVLISRENCAMIMVLQLSRSSLLAA
jgi:DNA-binding response OmpR family regulator